MKDERDISFVRVNILENWRFWNKYKTTGDFEGAGKEVIAQADALLSQDGSNERAEQLLQEGIEFRRKKQEAGKAGGHAKAMNRQQTPNVATEPPPKPQKGQAQPPTPQQLYDFAHDNGLDDAFAREWYEMTVVDRGFRDRDGNPIKNWKKAVTGYCNSKAQKLDF